eukprot:518-Heterococcus_DN1.PRE.2
MLLTAAVHDANRLPTAVSSEVSDRCGTVIVCKAGNRALCTYAVRKLLFAHEELCRKCWHAVPCTILSAPCYMH